MRRLDAYWFSETGVVIEVGARARIGTRLSHSGRFPGNAVYVDRRRGKLRLPRHQSEGTFQRGGDVRTFSSTSPTRDQGEMRAFLPPW